MKSKKSLINISFILLIIFLNEYNNVNAASYLRNKRQSNDQERQPGERVELSCSLTQEFSDELVWRRIDGVF